MTDSTGKVIPPDSKVDVPNLPKADPDKDATPDKGPLNAFKREAELRSDASATPQDGKARKVDPTASSWADSTQPAPDKKNARTSIL